MCTSPLAIKRHPRRGGFPEERHLVRRQAVGFVHQVAQLPFQLQRFGGLHAGRFDAAGVFVAEAFERGRRHTFLPPLYAFLKTLPISPYRFDNCSCVMA